MDLVLRVSIFLNYREHDGNLGDKRPIGCQTEFVFVCESVMECVDEVNIV